MTEHCTACGQPTLTFTERGFSCSVCGDEYVAPYFLRAVIGKWNRATAEMEAKLAKKEAKRAEKQGVEIAPAVSESRLTGRDSLCPDGASFVSTMPAPSGFPREAGCEKINCTRLLLCPLL